MLYHEFNMEDALAVRYAEGAAKESSYIKSLLEQGLSRDELLKKIEGEQNFPPCR
jgi:phosphoribosyl-ATP pyrophosphohydrolase